MKAIEDNTRKSYMHQQSEDRLTLIKARAILREGRIEDPNLIYGIKEALADVQCPTVIKKKDPKPIKPMVKEDTLFTPPPIPVVDIKHSIPEPLDGKKHYRRGDPTPDEVEGYDYIICHECGQVIRYQLSKHLTKHPEMTYEQYKQKYPDAQLYPEKFYRGMTLEKYLDKITSSGYEGPQPCGHLDVALEKIEPAIVKETPMDSLDNEVDKVRALLKELGDALGNLQEVYKNVRK